MRLEGNQERVERDFNGKKRSRRGIPDCEGEEPRQPARTKAPGKLREKTEKKSKHWKGKEKETKRPGEPRTPLLKNGELRGRQKDRI